MPNNYGFDPCGGAAFAEPAYCCKYFRGATGATGPRGEAGECGPQGIQGLPGLPGGCSTIEMNTTPPI